MHRCPRRTARRGHVPSRASFLTLLPMVVAACAGGDAVAVAEWAVRDSAGVRIVENLRPAWPADSGWQVTEEPSLSIGAMEGDEALLLSRVTGAVRLSDGRIVVADGGSTQLRYFDAAGRFLTAAGGAGDGPGEFRFLSQLWRRPGDTLAVVDLLPRVSYFDAGGRYLGVVPITPPEGALLTSIVAQAGDGTHLTMSGTRGYSAADAGRVIRDTIQLFRVAADGATGSLLGRVPGQERWGLQTGTRTSFPFLPFSAPGAWVASADRFVAGTGREAELRVWRTDGTLASLVRWRSERQPVTAELLDQYREYRLGIVADPNERRRIEQFLAEAPVADTLPVFQDLLADDLGQLWVEEFRPPWEPAPSWQVFAPDGRWLGRVRTPPRVRVFQIGDDFLLGRWLDEDDVEYVRLYPLVKPRGRTAPSGG